MDAFAMERKAAFAAEMQASATFLVMLRDWYVTVPASVHAAAGTDAALLPSQSLPFVQKVRKVVHVLTLTPPANASFAAWRAAALEPGSLSFLDRFREESLPDSEEELFSQLFDRITKEARLIINRLESLEDRKRQHTQMHAREGEWAVPASASAAAAAEPPHRPPPPPRVKAETASAAPAPTGLFSAQDPDAKRAAAGAPPAKRPVSTEEGPANNRASAGTDGTKKKQSVDPASASAGADSSKKKQAVKPAAGADSSKKIPPPAQAAAPAAPAAARPAAAPASNTYTTYRARLADGDLPDPDASQNGALCASATAQRLAAANAWHQLSPAGPATATDSTELRALEAAVSQSLQLAAVMLWHLEAIGQGPAAPTTGAPPQAAINALLDRLLAQRQPPT